MVPSPLLYFFRCRGGENSVVSSVSYTASVITSINFCLAASIGIMMLILAMSPVLLRVSFPVLLIVSFPWHREKYCHQSCPHFCHLDTNSCVVYRIAGSLNAGVNTLTMFQCRRNGTKTGVVFNVALMTIKLVSSFMSRPVSFPVLSPV